MRVAGLLVPMTYEANFGLNNSHSSLPLLFNQLLVN